MSDVVSGVRGAIGLMGETAIAAGEAAAIAAYPWLGLPVIKQIWESILEKYANAALKAMQDSSTRILVPIINQGQADAANEAKSKLQADLDNEKTKGEILQNDLAEFKEKYAALIRMRTST